MTEHKTLAGAMSALLAYRSRPEGEPVPLKTNWSLVAANDTEPENVADMSCARLQLVTPSVDEIMRQVATKDIEKNEAGQIVRIGRLKFSDGTQVEPGYKCAPGGGIVAVKHRMTAGALLGAQDKQHTIIGDTDNPPEQTASNRYFAKMFGINPKRRVPAKKELKRNGKGFSRNEAAAMLSEAYANTQNLPDVKTYPVGFPAASNSVADNFVGMKKAAPKDTGGSGWQDISTAMVDREIWAHAVADLSKRDKEVLDEAAHGRAKSYAWIGEAIGFSPEYARRKGGARVLRAANENLKQNLLKASA